MKFPPDGHPGSQPSQDGCPFLISAFQCIAVAAALYMGSLPIWVLA